MNLRSSRQLPQSIPLNAIDRAFLIPETEDIHGPHFPVSIVGAIKLKKPLEPESLIRAVSELDRRFPQFRLGYTLDYERARWQRVPEDQLGAYLASLVQVIPDSGDLAQTLSMEIRTNNVPLSRPFLLKIHGHDLILKMHHSMGDGTFMAMLTMFLLLALFNPPMFERLPDLPMNFGLPVWKLIGQSREQAVRICVGWLKMLVGYFRGYQREPLPDRPKLAPIVSGSEMCVALKIAPAESVALLREIKSALPGETQISLNTLLQVLIAERLIEMGLIAPPPIYTLPIDLHRYLRRASDFHAGNLLGQIKIKTTARPSFDIVAECIEIQTRLDRDLETSAPLFILPMALLFGLAGRKTNDRYNREEMLAGINTDPRFFVMSNFGNLNLRAKQFADYLDLSHGIFAAFPLMGGPRIVMVFHIMANQGNLTMIYDPRALSAAQVDDIAALFNKDWLSERLARIKTQEAATSLSHS
jgi:hypothetical protein